MTIFGKRGSEYVAFTKPFLALIIVLGIVRLALPFGGIPNSMAKWISVTAVIWIGILYYSIRVHTSGFGSYRQLLPILVLQSLAAEVIIASAIMLAIFTGQDNIYSVPEYSFGRDGKTWLHAAAHLGLGTTIGPLVGWLVGCLIMFATKKLVSKGKDTEAVARV